MIRVAFWDIDGTLIRTGGAGVKAFEATFERVFGLNKATETLHFAGRTDSSLVRECFVLHQIAPIEQNFRRFFDAYPEFLEQQLKALPGAVCDGVGVFMERLMDMAEPPMMALLTGNVRKGAELKLRHYGLWEHFRTGAFGDDHEDRNCIAGIARDRAEAKLGCKLTGAEMLVIGDTPHDITCGRSIGANVLGVATGNFTQEQLANAGATWAVDHLGDLHPDSLIGVA